MARTDKKLAEELRKMGPRPLSERPPEEGIEEGDLSDYIFPVKGGIRNTVLRAAEEKVPALAKPIIKKVVSGAEKGWDFVGKGLKVLDKATPDNSRSQKLEKLKQLFLD